MSKSNSPINFYGDGPPHWIVSEGKAWERASPTAHEASLQRNEAVVKLRWHGNRNNDDDALKLADTLASCARNCRCHSGACPLDERATQRWFVSASTDALPQLLSGEREAARVLSLVPDFGQAPVGRLSTFDIGAFRQSASHALHASNIHRFCLGVDVSLNHDESDVAGAYWQIQLWGFFKEPQDSWREALKARVNQTGAIRNPVKVVKPDSLEAAAAYGFKNRFVRRVSFIKANLHRDDRAECRNTRDRLLRGAPWIELMLFLDRIGLENRVLIEGVTYSHTSPNGCPAKRLGGQS